MYLYLIHHGLDASKAAQINEAVRIKIGHADGPDLARLIQLLQGTPCAVVIGKRLVQQAKIQIVRPQLTQDIE